MNKGKIVVLCPNYHALDAKVKDKYISEGKINTSETKACAHRRAKIFWRTNAYQRVYTCTPEGVRTHPVSTFGADPWAMLECREQ